MSLLSGMKKKAFTTGLMIMLAGTITMPVLASPCSLKTCGAKYECNDESLVNVNDIIKGEESNELVIRILEDGRYVTVPFDGVEVYATCTHTSIVGTGKMHKVTSSYNKTDATYCYKYRYYEDARCAQCGKTGYKIYDKTWTKVKHEYKLFGKTCTVCGYEK